jgi:hypothetical protein
LASGSRPPPPQPTARRRPRPGYPHRRRQPASGYPSRGSGCGRQADAAGACFEWCWCWCWCWCCATPLTPLCRKDRKFHSPSDDPATHLPKPGNRLAPPSLRGASGHSVASAPPQRARLVGHPRDHLPAAPG